MAFIGNVLRAGPSTPVGPRFLCARRLGRHRVSTPLTTSRWIGSAGRCRCSVVTRRARGGERNSKRAPQVPHGWTPMRAADVQDAVIRNVGARPWDRDHTDSRILADTIEGRGKIIDSEREVGGYPTQVASPPAFRRIRMGPALHDAHHRMKGPASFCTADGTFFVGWIVVKNVGAQPTVGMRSGSFTAFHAATRSIRFLSGVPFSCVPACEYRRAVEALDELVRSDRVVGLEEVVLRVDLQTRCRRPSCTRSRAGARPCSSCCRRAPARSARAARAAEHRRTGCGGTSRAACRDPPPRCPKSRSVTPCRDRGSDSTTTVTRSEALVMSSRPSCTWKSTPK